MLEAIFAEHKLEPSKTCMIGDRLNTDIEFGLNGGIDTLCVLTGITSKEELLSPENKVPSTFYMDSFGDFSKNE
jgi:4-nitrophenyl phosphatase